MNNDTSFDIIQESNPVQTVAQPKEDNEMLRATDRITALYCRLSVEDTKDEKKNASSDTGERIPLARKYRCLHSRIYGVHRLYGQFQNLHQLHLGQEAEGQPDGESQDFLQHPSGDYFFGSL